MLFNVISFIFNSKKDVKTANLTCAMVATTNPNVNAICTTRNISLAASSFPLNMVDATPTATKKKVPKNSANSIFHILRLFRMSLTPIIRLTPAKSKTNANKTCKQRKRHFFLVSKIIYEFHRVSIDIRRMSHSIKWNTRKKFKIPVPILDQLWRALEIKYHSTHITHREKGRDGRWGERTCYTNVQAMPNIWYLT